MEIKEFICKIILKLDGVNFELAKEKLIGEYLSFSFVDDSNVTRDILSEKLYDYLEKLELKTGKSEILSTYISDWDSIVSRKIVKEPQVKKNEPISPTSRARKYYEHACSIKKSRQYTLKQLEDYSRIMMCLYIAIIDAKYKEIEDFEYSSGCLNLDKIISSMKTEKATGPIKLGNKLRFDTKDLYCYDTCTFIFTLIMFCYIKNNEILGDYYDG